MTNINNRTFKIKNEDSLGSQLKTSIFITNAERLQKIKTVIGVILLDIESMSNLLKHFAPLLLVRSLTSL